MTTFLTASLSSEAFILWLIMLQNSGNSIWPEPSVSYCRGSQKWGFLWMPHFQYHVFFPSFIFIYMHLRVFFSFKFCLQGLISEYIQRLSGVSDFPIPTWYWAYLTLLVVNISPADKISWIQASVRGQVQTRWHISDHDPPTFRRGAKALKNWTACFQAPVHVFCRLLLHVLLLI